MGVARKEAKTATAFHLEHLCTTAVEVVNQGDFPFQTPDGRRLLEHIAPRWEAKLDNFPYTLALDDLTSMWRENTRAGGEVHATILHMGSHVRDNDRVASVYLHLELKGTRPEDGVSVYSFCELKWRRTDEKWMCHSCVGMRKPCSDSGIAC